MWLAVAAELEARASGSPYSTTYFPDGWSGKVAGHMPVLSINGTSATVTVDHGMSSAHFIDTIYVRDQSGAVVHMQTFDGSEASAQTTFEIPSSATTLTAYEHCNLHGLWKSVPQQYSASFASSASAPTPVSTLRPVKKANEVVASVFNDVIRISWEPGSGAIDTLKFTVVLKKANVWVGIAFSEMGRMVHPSPSRAVVGTSKNGVPTVRKLSLTEALQLTGEAGVDIDAVQDDVQDLVDETFSQESGETTMTFVVTSAYANSRADSSGNTHMIFAYGDSPALKYHDDRKGSFSVNLGPQSTSVASAPVAMQASMCNDPAISYELGLCYLSYSSTQKAEYDPIYKTFDHHQHLSAEFLLAWSVVRGSGGYISVMMSARTLGWLGFGLMSEGVRHGMINTDMWFGKVENGKVVVIDSYAFSIAPPVSDIAVTNGTEDLYDISGLENATSGITTIMFKRKLESNDPNDYTIRPGPMPSVFAFNRQNSDLLTSYHGPTRGFSTITFFEPLTKCTELDHVIQFETCDRSRGMKKYRVFWTVPDVTKRACEGDLMPPPQVECDFVPWQSGSGQVVIVGAVLSIIVALVISSWVLRNGDLPILKAAQRPFCFVICSGSILLNVAMLLQLGPSTVITCQARIWLFNLSFDLMFAALFTKVHRAYKILTNPTLKKIRMTDMMVYRSIGAIVGVDFIIISAWNIAEPYVPRTVETVVQGFSQLKNQRVECTPSVEFVGIAIMYKAVLLLWGCWLSWHGRQISDTYSESKQMLFVIYGISGQATIVLLVSFAITGISQGNILMVQGIVVSWSVVAALSAIFLPKFKMRGMTQFDIVQSATASTAATSTTKYIATSNESVSNDSMASPPKSNSMPKFSAPAKVVPITQEVEKDHELQVLCKSIEKILREPFSEDLRCKLKDLLILAQSNSLQTQKTQHM